MFDSEFSPQTGAKSGKVKTEYKQDLVTIAADMDLNMAGPVVNASAVVGHQGWLGGNFDKKKIPFFVEIKIQLCLKLHDLKIIFSRLSNGF